MATLVVGGEDWGVGIVRITGEERGFETGAYD